MDDQIAAKLKIGLARKTRPFCVRMFLWLPSGLPMSWVVLRKTRADEFESSSIFYRESDAGDGTNGCTVHFLGIDMRPEIRRLIELGRLPSEDDGDVETLRKYEIEYRGITQPITDEEAIALLKLFGEDGCFGLASSLMHLVETAPGWPIKAGLTDTRNPWILELKNRAIRGGVF